MCFYVVGWSLVVAQFFIYDFTGNKLTKFTNQHDQNDHSLRILLHLGFAPSDEKFQTRMVGYVSFSFDEKRGPSPPS